MSGKINLGIRSSKSGIINEQFQEISRQSPIAIGKVKKIDARVGQISVWVLGSSTDENNDDGWRTLKYASPYMGFTQGDLIKRDNNIEFTKQVYGISMILPDLDNLVLCAFPGTDTSQEGYWFATISNNLSNFSLPAHGSIKHSLIDPSTIDPKIASFLTPDGRYPVGEVNEYARDTAPSALNIIDSNLPTTKKPLNPELTFQYIAQGLDTDIHRGVISSSSQRLGDLSPTVFGISTPGRKKSRDKQRRLAGHSLIMDDGDETGNNQLVRWRTAAGHQVLMNDNAGIIYISNASGLSWVELSATGDVQIYGARDFAIRTQGNVDIHSDRSIRMHANDIQMFSKVTTKIESEQDFSIRTTQNFSQYTGSTHSINSNTFHMNNRGATYMKSSGKTDIKASGKIYLNSDGDEALSIEPAPLKQNRLPDAIFNQTQGWLAQDQTLFSTAEKVPTHEPYIRVPFESYSKALTEIVQAQEQAKKQDQSKQQSKSSTANKIAASVPSGISNPLNETAISSATNAINSATNITGSATDAINSTLAKTELATKAPNLAPDSSFRSQALPPESINGFQRQETQAYMAQIAHTESGGKYDAVNQFGYAGKYQMGSAALQDAGLLKPGTPQTPEAIQNPNNWVGGPGKPNSLEEFLTNSDIQEQTMVDYTNRNLSALKRTGAISGNSTKEEISGALAAAHLVGPGGATKLIKTGADPQDGNGTKASQYYANGQAAVKKATQIATAEQAKNQLGA